MKNKFTAISLVIFSLIPVSVLAYAAGGVDLIDPGTRTVPDILNNIVGWVLGFTGSIAVLFLIWGGIQYVTSAGNKERVELAKKTITYAVIGIIVIVLAETIVVLVTNTVGDIISVSQTQQQEVATAAIASETDAKDDLVVATTVSADAPEEDPLANLSDGQAAAALADEEVPDAGEDQGTTVSTADLKKIKKEGQTTSLNLIDIFLNPQNAYAASKSAIADNASNIARAKVGVKESEGNTGDAIQKFFNATKPNKDCKTGNPWCAAFLSWAFKSAGVNNFATCSSVKLINGFKHNGHKQYKYGKSSKLKPKNGDVLWRPRKGGAGHVGIIWNVYKDGNDKIHTLVVEGNSDDQVVVKDYANYGKNSWTKLGRL